VTAVWLRVRWRNNRRFIECHRLLAFSLTGLFVLGALVGMAVSVVDGKLHYSGRHLVLKLGSVLIPIPEWLVLGHTTIVETALDEGGFAMDFRLTHPWFGQVFRYAGQFRTESRT